MNVFFLWFSGQMLRRINLFHCFCRSPPPPPPTPPPPVLEGGKTGVLVKALKGKRERKQILIKIHQPQTYPITGNTVDTLSEFKEIPKFIPRITQGKCIKVYDGDTITIASSLPYDTQIYRFSIRLRNIDCPEIHTRNPQEKKVAEMAKAFVLDHVLGQVVYLTNVDLDKYGRVLANVHLTSERTSPCLSDLLLLERLAVPYDGGEKKTPTDWLAYHVGDCELPTAN